MSSLELPDRSLAFVIIEVSVCLALNIISIIGNTLVCLAVYKNPKLRSNTSLYIVALAASDLLCATVEMPLASAVLITGRWGFSNALCELQGFVDVFATYVTPAIMGLTAFNRYIRIVKTQDYNRFFSPRRSKVWLSCVWLSLSCYLLIGRVTNWNRFEFIPGYAVCSVVFAERKRKAAHYSVVFGLFSLLPFFIACFSYYKVFSTLRRHNLHAVPSLNISNNRTGRLISAKEINISRTLSYVAAGFLFCWIPLWAFAFWKRSSPETAPRIVELFVTLMLFMSASINPFIYTATSRAFRGEFNKLLCWWKVARVAPEVASVASKREVNGVHLKKQQNQTNS
ncbi:histamine H2 receptor-like [Oculina patagonica]